MVSALRVDVIGSGNGATKVLLIHGSGSAARPISRLGNLIVDAVPDCEAVSVNLAGYGSVTSDQAMPIVDQHLELVLHAIGTEDWHLVGHSMGGFLALQVARRIPRQIASLSLIEPTAFGVLDPDEDRDALEVDRAVIRAFEAGRKDSSGISHFVEAWNQSAWEDLPEAVRSRLVSMEPQIYEEATAVSLDETPVSAYEALTQPVLLVVGTNSLLPAKRIVQRLSKLPAVSDLRWIDSAGHMDAVRRPEAFAAEIADHICRCIRRG